ncbi:hypothetical protein FOFC_19206 [Fusarium oxysporum]|nr:hypothetical protein FOFC_19206 [Fusarium oxysporum]
MATLNALKKALKKVSDEAPRKPLNDEEYGDGLSLFAQASGEQTYQKTFIIPQLSELIASLSARDEISVLEIGPGPENVLGHLPAILRKRITKYVALEPSFQYTQSLTRWLSPMEDERPLPSLKHSLVRPAPFTPESCKGQNYDVILFCHSLYGMKRKEKIIRNTLKMLPKDPLGALLLPLDISQVQSCVRWALANKTSLEILGGGHSDHCLWPNVVSVEMGAFDKVYVVNTPQNADTDCWVVAEAGCKTGDIIKETMPAGVTVTLGSRPSVGAGFWLQGGIGHLARHYGLACDAIVGAVMVDAISGQVLCIGHVPEHNIDHRMPFSTNMMRNYSARNTAPEDTAFGCIDWDFAGVVTGVWPREYDGTRIYDAVIHWVYRVVNELLPMSKGVYGADLGPDPRDSNLATKAFGPNRRRLKLVILVTSEHGAGKDYCANIWSAVFKVHGYSSRVVSISEVTKRKYAAATDANPDRPYKEQHRKSINDFYKNQLKKDPFVAENHFLEVLKENASDVLFITGLTEMASAGEATRNLRRWGDDSKFETTYCEKYMYADGIYLLNFNFDNEENGDETVIIWLAWCQQRRIFQGKDIDFRYVLNIAKQKGGLALCTSLLKSHFSGDWKKVDAVVTSETSGYVLASPLAMEIEIPLVLIAKGNKFPPPTVSVQRRMSYISSRILNASDKGRFEVDANVVRKGDSVVIVDDVLVTGEALVAVLELLVKVGLQPEDISVMVAAKFPFHRGREKLWAHGFGRVAVQSLLVLDGQ